MRGTIRNIDPDRGVGVITRRRRNVTTTYRFHRSDCVNGCFEWLQPGDVVTFERDDDTAWWVQAPPPHSGHVQTRLW